MFVTKRILHLFCKVYQLRFTEKMWLFNMANTHFVANDENFTTSAQSISKANQQGLNVILP